MYKYKYFYYFYKKVKHLKFITYCLHFAYQI